mmetsp:Transcript_11625/g.21739  ORF Transcript_11625/g.21739 Transcript_11625/m.21739 type:complete len:376 (+) Transcript_11625:132-1259(+)
MFSSSFCHAARRVSHSPHLSNLSERICCFRESSSSFSLTFSAICCILSSVYSSWSATILSYRSESSLYLRCSSSSNNCSSETRLESLLFFSFNSLATFCRSFSFALISLLCLFINCAYSFNFFSLIATFDILAFNSSSRLLNWSIFCWYISFSFSIIDQSLEIDSCFKSKSCFNATYLLTSSVCSFFCFSNNCLSFDNDSDSLLSFCSLSSIEESLISFSSTERIRSTKASLSASSSCSRRDISISLFSKDFISDTMAFIRCKSSFFSALKVEHSRSVMSNSLALSLSSFLSVCNLSNFSDRSWKSLKDSAILPSRSIFSVFRLLTFSTSSLRALICLSMSSILSRILEFSFWTPSLFSRTFFRFTAASCFSDCT